MKAEKCQTEPGHEGPHSQENRASPKEPQFLPVVFLWACTDWHGARHQKAMGNGTTRNRKAKRTVSDLMRVERPQVGV